MISLAATLVPRTFQSEVYDPSKLGEAVEKEVSLLDHLLILCILLVGPTGFHDAAHLSAQPRGGGHIRTGAQIDSSQQDCDERDHESRAIRCADATKSRMRRKWRLPCRSWR